jgi:hypothetical protein
LARTRSARSVIAPFGFGFAVEFVSLINSRSVASK